jgi:hypothetical protein
MTYRPAPGLPSPFPWTDLVQSPQPLSAQNLSHGASGPSTIDKIGVQRPLGTKTVFLTLFCRMSKEKTSQIQPCSDIVLARLQRKPKATTRDSMLQIHWYLRVGSDARHFCKVWKNKKKFGEEQHRARF